MVPVLKTNNGNELFHFPMKANLRNPYLVAAFLTLVLASIFFLFPIEVFDGEVTYTNGVQSITIRQRLSLSYFIGMGFEEGKSMRDISHMALVPKGYVLAILMIVGFPALIGYRVWLSNQHRERDSASGS